MGLQRILTSKWFTRLVLVSFMACSVSIYFVFKNMEFIVHGQLYDFGLIFSPEWADSYRVFTWLIFLCLGVPMALSGLALASSFLNVGQMPERERIVPQKSAGVTKIGYIGSPQSRPVQQSHQAQESDSKTISRVENGNCVGISCPECKKVFGRALVMLDFRSGSNRMVSVCPYCNYVLGYTSEEKTRDDAFIVGSQDKKIPH